MAEVNEVNFAKGGKMADEGGKGKLIRIIVIAVVALVVIGGGIFAAMHFMGGKDKEGDKAHEGKDEKGGEHVSLEGVGPAAGVCETEQLQYVELGTFIVNLADGKRYLKATVSIMLCDKKVAPAAEFLKKRTPELKDIVVAELQVHTGEQLRDPKERELLKQKLLSKVESLMPNTEDKNWDSPNPIKRVLITDFYLQ